MKKKLIAALLAGAMVLMTACGSAETTEKQEPENDVVQEEVVSESTEETEVVEETEVTEETEVVEEVVVNPKKIIFRDTINVVYTCEFDENGNVIKVLEDYSECENLSEANNMEWTLEYLYDENGNVVYGIDPYAFRYVAGSSDAININTFVEEVPMLAHVEGKNSSTYDETSLFDGEMSVYEYEYDAENRLINKEYNSAIDKEGYTYNYNNFTGTKYEYTDNKWVVHLTEYLNNCDMFISFDDMGNVIEYIEIYEGTCLQCSGYEYDENGNMIKCIRYDETMVVYENGELVNNNTTGETREYIYDERGNLISEFAHETVQVENTYDENNNLLEEKYAWGSRGLYNYNEKGQLTEYTTFYEEEQNNWTYEYDEEGRMVKASLNGELIYQFTYNEEGLLINCEKSRLLTASGEGSFTIEGFFIETIANNFKNIQMGNLKLYDAVDEGIIITSIDRFSFYNVIDITIEY